MSELTTKPAVEQLAMLERRTVSAVELAQEHLGEIARLNPILNAFVDVHLDEVLSAAREADRLRSRRSRIPSLLGLPCSIKSSIEVRGHLCETGSALHRGFRPSHDADIVRQLRQAGAIPLGTTNCPELLMAYETDNLLYGPTRNPWNPEYQAGGSSGGEAAAIAAGMSAGGIGSDSGGSVRVPAHFTGICSFKPTSGMLSSRGHTLPCSGPFATLGSLGPMARTMKDISLLMAALTPRMRQKHAPELESLRARPIAVIEDDGLIPVTRETRVTVQMAARALERAGFRIVPYKCDKLEAARRLWHEFFVRCGLALLEPSLPKQEDLLSPTFQYFLTYARKQDPISGYEVLNAWAEADGLRKTLSRELHAYSAVLSPVSAIPAFRHGERSWQIDDTSVEYFDAMRFTQWFNLLGAPAAVIPVHRSEENLPIAVQIAGPTQSDAAVLSIAGILDEAFGYTVPLLA